MSKRPRQQIRAPLEIGDDEPMVFAQYLIGRPIRPTVVARYQEALVKLGLETPESEFDHRLLEFATGGAWRAECLDTFSAFLARDSLLRKRLYVMTALLETDPDYADVFLTNPTGRAAMTLRLAGTAVRALAALMQGALYMFSLRVRN